MQLSDLLSSPGREFTPVPFWFLNGDLTVKELRRQLGDFAAHGVYGVVLHPRMGLARRIGYLSGTYFYYIRAAVQAADELGMKIVLYDEGMYPSGSACGQVVAGHPELASEGLALVKTALPTDELLAQTSAGFLVARKSGGTLRGVHWGEDDGEPDAPASADILNPEAVDRFLALTHEAYYRVLKKWFGSVIIGFFTDEPSILGRGTPAGMASWTRGFAADFTAAGGNLSNLTALFCGEENADTALYRRMILERESVVYYGRLSSWCERHGIALMGHPHRSDDIEVERYFHVPGQDLVLRWVAPEKNNADSIDTAMAKRSADNIDTTMAKCSADGNDIATAKCSADNIDTTMAKCSADAARLAHRRRNSNECFGACNKDGNPWQFSGADMKWYLDWLAVRGVNLFIPHAFYYSIAGKRRDERPPDVGPHSIWWENYMLWAKYMSRLSCLMTDAKLITHVAVLCRNRDLKPRLTNDLFRRQISFQYLPESVWPRCREEGGVLIYDGSSAVPEEDGALICGGRSVAPGEKSSASSVPEEHGNVSAVPEEYAIACAVPEQGACTTAVPRKSGNASVRPELAARTLGRTERAGIAAGMTEADFLQRVSGREMHFDAVFGEREVFPTVSHPSLGELASIEPDCVCMPPQPQLRCAHFYRAGHECWLLVNEGEETIQSTVMLLSAGEENIQGTVMLLSAGEETIQSTVKLLGAGEETVQSGGVLQNADGKAIPNALPVSAFVGQLDLWSGKAAQAGETNQIDLILRRRESLLLFVCTDEEYAALPPKRREVLLPLPDFMLTGEDKARAQKTYEAELEFNPQAAAGQDALLELEAEEMAELFVNGEAAGVSFWSPHRFALIDFLRPGKNSLRLVVTGSLANLYGKKPVAYGLIEKRKEYEF